MFKHIYQVNPTNNGGQFLNSSQLGKVVCSKSIGQLFDSLLSYKIQNVMGQDKY